MSDTSVYECPECHDRKMVDYTDPLPPTVWCNCEGFVCMNVVDE